MDSGAEKPDLRTSEHIQAELRRLGWAEGLSEETLMAIANVAEWVEFQTGEVVIEVDSEITHACFLVSGEMRAALCDFLGKEIQKDTLVRGSVIGLFSLGLSDRSHLHVVATEHSTAIGLTLAN